MYSKEQFTKMVLEKYPDATIYTDEQGYSGAGRKTNKQIEFLGCVLCFGDKNLEMRDNHLFIQGVEAISAKSVIEDDSLNPAMTVLFFCPICSRMIVNPDITRLPLLGRVVDDWKD